MIRKSICRYWLLLLLLQLVPAIWLCRDFIFAGRYLLSTEVLDMSLPWAQHLDQTGWRFAEALWDRTSFCGTPFLANPATRTFYPPDVFFRLLTPLSPEACFNGLIFLHAWVLGIGGAVWLRSFGYLLPSCSLAGWIFVLNGYVVSRVGLADPAFLFAITWIPWILHLLRKCGTRRTRLGLVVTGVLEILAGRPDILVYLAYLAAGYFLWLWVPRLFHRHGWKRLLRENGWLPPIGLTIFLLTALQTLPSMEYQSLSINRSGESQYELATKDSLPPFLFLASLFPGCFGEPTASARDLATDQIERYWVQGTGFHEIYFYLGQGALLLALLGVATARSRLTAFWLVVTGVSCMLAMGGHFFLYRWAFDLLPGWNRFRVPPRVLVLVLPALAWLAASGLEALIRAGRQTGHGTASSRRSLAVLGVAAGLWAAAALFGLMSSEWVIEWNRPYIQTPLHLLSEEGMRILEGRVTTFRNACLAASTLGMAAVLLALSVLRQPSRIILSTAKDLGSPEGCTTQEILRFAQNDKSEGMRGVGWRGGHRRVALTWGIPILVLIDLAWMNGDYLKGVSRAEVVDALPEDPLIGKFRESSAPGRLLVLAPALDYRRRPIHPWFFPGRVFHYGVESVGGYGPFLLKDYVETFQKVDPRQPVYNGGLLLYLFDVEGVNSEVLNLFQVTGVISPSRPVRGFPVEATHTYSGVSGEQSELFLCRNPHHYPRAFLYRNFPGYPKPDPALGTVEFREAVSTRVHLTVDVREDCRLALLETWFPGWKCTTNSREQPIAKTAGTFRSIEIEQGHSEVVFTYEPTSWRRGLTLSSAGILAAVMLSLL